MTDHDELRRLAENATPGPWEARSLRNADIPGKKVVGPRAAGDISTGPVVLMQPIFWDERSAANAEFIAAANPTTILALLDELRTAYDRGARETYEWILARQQGLEWEEPKNPYEEDQ